MQRYIDADKLWNDRPQFPISHSALYAAGFNHCMFEFSTLIRKHIDNSSADVVEVVRCKDCKFARGIGCPFHEAVRDDENDYCSYGKRRAATNDR